MINENEILPFNFFTYGGIYTGQNENMRFKIKREGSKPDFVLTVWVWKGPFASDYVEEEDKTRETFEYSEEGRMSAINWLKEQYETRLEEWNSIEEN